MAETVHLAGGSLVVGHIFDIYAIALLIYFVDCSLLFLWCPISQVALMSKGALPAAL